MPSHMCDTHNEIHTHTSSSLTGRGNYRPRFPDAIGRTNICHPLGARWRPESRDKASPEAADSPPQIQMPGSWTWKPQEYTGTNNIFPWSRHSGGGSEKSSWLARPGPWALEGQGYSCCGLFAGGPVGTICPGLVPTDAWHERAPSGLFLGVECVCVCVLLI